MTQIKKYTWLIDLLKREALSINEISERWADNRNLSEGKPLSRATFCRWREAISSQLGLFIKCNTHDGYTYYIDDDDAITGDTVSRWMVNTYAVCNVLTDNRDIRQRISVPQIPSGQTHLVDILSAIRYNKEVSITYCHFGGEPYDVKISPMCVRLYDSRWYVIGVREDGEHRTYSLDRVRSVRTTGRESVVDKDFDADEYFRDSFGIVMQDAVKPCRIVLRTYGSHINYMRTLPLHHSQNELAGGKDTHDEYVDFEYYMSSTYDLVMHIAGLGAMVKVLKPASLAEEVVEWLGKAREMYT